MKGSPYAAAAFLRGLLPDYIFTGDLLNLPKNLLEERIRDRFSIKDRFLEHSLKQRIWDDVGRASRFYLTPQVKTMFGFVVLWNSFLLLRSVSVGKEVPYHLMYRVSFLPEFSPDSLGRNPGDNSFWDSFRRILSSYFASCGGSLPDIFDEMSIDTLKEKGSMPYEAALEKRWFSLASRLKISSTFTEFLKMRYSFFVRRLSATGLREDEAMALMGVSDYTIYTKDYRVVKESDLAELPGVEVDLSRRLFRKAFHEFHFKFDESLFFSFYMITNYIVRDLIYLFLSPSPSDSRLVALVQISGR